MTTPSDAVEAGFLAWWAGFRSQHSEMVDHDPSCMQQVAFQSWIASAGWMVERSHDLLALEGARMEATGYPSRALESDHAR